jgi:hypothetical protein
MLLNLVKGQTKLGTHIKYLEKYWKCKHTITNQQCAGLEFELCSVFIKPPSPLKSPQRLEMFVGITTGDWLKS